MNSLVDKLKDSKFRNFRHPSPSSPEARVFDAGVAWMLEKYAEYLEEAEAGSRTVDLALIEMKELFGLEPDEAKTIIIEWLEC